MIVAERLDKFIEKFPLFLPTIKKLNENSIPWAIGGSGCLYILGNERKPGDADISVLTKDHDKVDDLFRIKSFTHVSDTEEVRNSNPYGNHDIQMTSSIILNVGGEKYDCSLTEITMKHRIVLNYKGTPIYLNAPEDVLVVKALLQRGQDVGKNDLGDIENFLRIYKSLDKEYLSTRIRELHTEERIGSIL